MGAPQAVRRLAPAPLAVAIGLVVGLLPGEAAADGLRETGQELRDDRESVAEVDGYFRGRGELMYNFDLDRGPTPSGRYLYPLPVSQPRSPWLTHGDMRLRTDLSLRPKWGQVEVRARLDVVDNLTFGSTPRGTPTNTTSQRPPGLDSALRLKRFYGRVMTPFGLLAVGRMGADWGLGMLANGGNCRDCDSGDAADRIAFMTPIGEHVWALAYDLAYRGPNSSRASGNQRLDLDPSDDVHTVTFAFTKFRPEWVRNRRRRAGRSTLDYGAYLSYRWQHNDFPTHYVPTASDISIDSSQAVARQFRAIAVDGWVRYLHPLFRAEIEVAYLDARIEQPSLVPGLELDRPITGRQWGGALETTFGRIDSPIHGGLDAGVASGDPAPGFGAGSEFQGRRGQPGDLRGAQARYPNDLRVDNFSFHPDYRIDRILFDEIIGTVTDAVYLRPHFQWMLLESGPTSVEFRVASPVSWTLNPESAPGGVSPLGLEVDPSLIYRNARGFLIALDYGILFPFEGLGSRTRDVTPNPAQLFKLSAIYQF